MRCSGELLHAALPLGALSLGMLSVGTTSLVVLGLAQSMTTGLGVSSGAAGTLVTAFAFTYAVAAPLLQFVLGGRVGQRLLIVGGLCVLGAGSLWGAFASSFHELALSRTLAALGGAAVGPTSAAAGAALVPEQHRGRALAIVFAGFTVATVVGVPTATWLDLRLGWRGALGSVGALALMSSIAVGLTVQGGGDRKPLHPRAFLRLLQRLPVAAALGTATMHLAAQFTIYALMAALLVERFGLEPAQLPMAILMFGLGGVLGNAAAGILADRFGAGRTVLASFVGLAAIFILLLLPLPPMIAATAVASCAAFGTLFTAPQQVRLTALVAPQDHAAVLALNASAGSIGLSIGATAASLTHAGYGLHGLPPAALLLLLAAIGLFHVSSRRVAV
jgi:MFS transporter, DHA1 family, inner membrane transport protein